MKTLELPDNLAAQIESFRQRRGQRWAEQLEKLLQQEEALNKWDEEVWRPGPEAARFSEEEAERLAVQEVREVRRERKF